MIDFPAIHAHTTAILRARAAYDADECVRAGICGTCHNHPIYRRERTCAWCRKERR